MISNMALFKELLHISFLQYCASLSVCVCVCVFDESLIFGLSLSSMWMWMFLLQPFLIITHPVRRQVSQHIMSEFDSAQLIKIYNNKNTSAPAGMPWRHMTKAGFTDEISVRKSSFTLLASVQFVRRVCRRFGI